VRIIVRKTIPASKHGYRPSSVRWFRNGLLHRSDLDAGGNPLYAVRTSGPGGYDSYYTDGVCISQMSEVYRKMIGRP